MPVVMTQNLDLDGAYAAYVDYTSRGIYPSTVGFVALINLTAGTNTVSGFYFYWCCA
jgi:hypothetical protein